MDSARAVLKLCVKTPTGTEVQLYICTLSYNNAFDTACCIVAHAHLLVVARFAAHGNSV